ncbi:high affinity immunoglobulin epsilon receptor subunit gamma-like [Bombina bombina]|uniref:high affinity immunoglobulin epsilon receptor subunit gamma-like n=1 Tax=Bombina bombina TaxID=8345 RepID=UPI00235A8B16|nr:high affinity immunoglobulin epsilon receptor subunit gamma-like [Bombina bombina]
MWIIPIALLLSRVQGTVAGMQEPEICYVLDAILFLYGIVLTALYCHLKVKTAKAQKSSAHSEHYEQLNFPEKQIYSEIGKGHVEMETKQ